MGTSWCSSGTTCWSPPRLARRSGDTRPSPPTCPSGRCLSPPRLPRRIVTATQVTSTARWRPGSSTTTGCMAATAVLPYPASPGRRGRGGREGRGGSRPRPMFPRPTEPVPLSPPARARSKSTGLSSQSAPPTENHP